MKLGNVIIFIVMAIAFYFVMSNLIEANNYYRETNIYSHIYS